MSGNQQRSPKGNVHRLENLNNPDGFSRLEIKMLNKDKRSLLLCLVLGDGCLHHLKRGNKIYGSITIDHGLSQADYQAWKAKLLSEIFNKDVKVRTGHNGKSIQVSVSQKKLRIWRKFTYPNNKKSIPDILKYIRHQELALSVWLMDDGYVEPSITNNKNYSAALRIFTCDQDLIQQELIQKWLKDNFQIESKIRYQKKGNKKYPFIKINSSDSLKIWEKIRQFILTFKSMQYKFRYLEQIYQFRISQRIPNES